MALQLQVNHAYFNRQRLAFERRKLEAIHGRGNSWTTEELRARFEIIGCMGRYCVVKDRMTGKMGSVEFREKPRLYFEYQQD